jgi:hypothetical protein
MEAPMFADMRASIFSGALSIEELARQHRVDEIIVAVREQRDCRLPMDQLLASRIRGIPVLDLAAFANGRGARCPLTA